MSKLAHKRLPKGILGVHKGGQIWFGGTRRGSILIWRYKSNKRSRTHPIKYDHTYCLITSWGTTTTTARSPTTAAQLPCPCPPMRKNSNCKYFKLLQNILSILLRLPKDRKYYFVLLRFVLVIKYKVSLFQWQTSRTHLITGSFFLSFFLSFLVSFFLYVFFLNENTTYIKSTHLFQHLFVKLSLTYLWFSTQTKLHSFSATLWSAKICSFFPPKNVLLIKMQLFEEIFIELWLVRLW